MLSVLFSYAFSPVVNWLEHRRVPRWLGSAVLLLSILGAIGHHRLCRSATRRAAMVESLPVAAQKFRNALKRSTGNSDQHAGHRAEGGNADRAGGRRRARRPAPPAACTRVVVEKAQLQRQGLPLDRHHRPDQR